MAVEFNHVCASVFTGPFVVGVGLSPLRLGLRHFAAKWPMLSYFQVFSILFPLISAPFAFLGKLVIDRIC